MACLAAGGLLLAGSNTVRCGGANSGDGVQRASAAKSSTHPGPGVELASAERWGERFGSLTAQISMRNSEWADRLFAKTSPLKNMRISSDAK